jgi:two-component system phosphate regulon sensor histidine kinase PhoR
VNFTGRLVVGTFTVVVCTIIVLLWGSERALRSDLEGVMQTRIARDANAAVASLSTNPLHWPADAHRLSVQTGHRVVVHIGDSLVAATDSLRGERFLTASATRGNARVQLSASVGPVEDAVRRARNSMLAAAAFALLLSLGLAVVAGRSIAAPLLEVSASAGAIAAGAAPRFPRSRIPEVDRMVGALRDMHEQLAARFAALQREKAESAAIVESMVEGIIATDAGGRIITVNAAARALLGYGAAAAMPPLATLFRAKTARAAVDEVLGGGAVVDRELALDGSTLLLNARPLPGGGAVLVLHDLTEVRRLEAVRRDFVANVSHELKTPLTSISGYAETLRDESVDADTRQRFVGTILANARRMQHLVDDLLDLARIESGRWMPRPVPSDVRFLAAEAWSGFADRAAGRNIAFELHVAPDAATVRADPDAVNQVLCNLFDNAIRHVADGGAIALHASRDGQGVMIRIADNGTGIPQEHLPRIFERFYRADASRSRDQGGTGLGLAIVGIESAPRAGTAVSVWLPDAADEGGGAL